MDDSRQELKAIQDYLKREAPRKYDENPIYYVYTHDNADPTRGELGCRWIGKGHGKRAFYFKRNVHYDAIFSEEFPPEITFVVENVDEETAFEIEKWMIANAKAAGIKLCNMTDGGEGKAGAITTEETKIKQSNANKNKPKTKEHRENIAKAKLGVKMNMTEKMKRSVYNWGHCSQGRIYVWKNGKLKRIEPEELGKYVADGWEKRGCPRPDDWGERHSKHMSGRKWVHKETERKMIWMNQMNEYLIDGWVVGKGQQN